MAGGRPTKYTPELLEKAKDYLENWKSTGRAIPSHIGLFLHLDIARDTGYDWAKQESKKAFSDILDKCMDLQQIELIDNGLKGEFNAAITKLALGKHGFSDKVEQDVTTGGEKISNNFIIQPVTTKKDS